MKHKFFLTAIVALVPLYSAICFSCSPIKAQAETAPSYFEGVDASGLMIKGNSSPVIVENERLYLKITSLPHEGKVALDEYNAVAAAEYTFSNPRKSQVDMTLLFPFGTVPSYMTEGAEDTVSSFLVGGEEVECNVRYTYSSDSFNADSV